ncbi:cytochrome b-c1 complex subunit Rieske, mitochondrial-like [Choristoneura fumiferana]|uniref:cytochrome b-c1 complex subunit Rieske, mitochondrial-like n=1 Tax=Choristoneura fumiferana TaxID=7141 RepID=UPI003D15AD6D
MSLLSGGLGRYGGLAFWHAPCYRDALKSINLIAVDDHVYKQNINRSPHLERQSSKHCVPRPSALTLWTQVRFQKGAPGPRFHRDIDFPNFDPYRKEEYKDVRKTCWGAGDGKQGYTYVMGFFGMICAAYGVKSELTHFLHSMSAAADVLAMASIEVDVSKIAAGACSSFKWRGKPLFVKNRTAADIDLEEKTPMSALRDPQTQEQRTQKPEWLIVIGICTHLGCVPIPNSGDWAGGFYCPCHGSHYDNMGRARKGPAPLNLEVPPYKFVSDTVVLVG